MSRGKRRPVAEREDIMAAATTIGVREGWKAVTIRSVATELGYTSPLLYEHFQNKEDLLTEIAADGLRQLKALLTQDRPSDAHATVRAMIERYWDFMSDHSHLYRLMNGMDSAPINKEVLRQSAHSLCEMVAIAVRPLLGKEASDADARIVADELWALLHGMATLYLDRAAPFDVARATSACTKLIRGWNVSSVPVRSVRPNKSS